MCILATEPAPAVLDRAMLDVQGLRAGYGQSEVLHGIDFAVAPGEGGVFVGRNGLG